MKKTKFGRSLMACLLVLVMMLGTCTTSFAATIDPEAFVDEVKTEAEVAIEEIKAIVDDIVVAVESKNADLQKALKAEYVAAVDAKLAELNVVLGPKSEEIAEKLGESLDIIIEGVAADQDVGTMVDAHIALVSAYLTAEQVDFITWIKGEIEDIVAAAEANNIDAIKEKIGKYADEVKAKYPEAADVVNVVAGEAIAALDIAADGKVDETEKAKIEEKVEYYTGLLNDELNKYITEEDKAKMAEFVAEIAEIVEVVKATSPEEVKATVDAKIAELKAKAEKEIAKLGHKHYEADENSYYVAIGGDTVSGKGVDFLEGETTYTTLVKEGLSDEEKGIEVNNAVVKVANDDELLPSEVLGLVDDNKDEIANADIITYQTDASAFIQAALKETPDWSRYIDEATAKLVNDIITKTTEVLDENWEAYADAKVEKFVEYVKAEVAEVITSDAVKDYIVISETDLNNLIDKVVDYVYEIIKLVSDKKEDTWPAVKEIKDNELIKDFAEKLAYGVVAYAVDTVKAIEKIQDIKPEAALYVVGMYNPVKGLEIVTEDATIDAGEIFEYVIAATNIYYAGLAAANGNFAFVDVSDAEINGFEGTQINISDINNIDMGSIASILNTVKMSANAKGHETIANNILAAMKCDYSAYEKVDADYHNIICAICGDVKGKEGHSYNTDGKCVCGAEEPKEEIVYHGGGAAIVKFTVRFNTNGGSAIASVAVTKGKLLEEPKAPTKAGYIFDGWYTDKELTTKYDFSQPVTKGFTLYAKWTEALTQFTDLDKDAWYYEYVKTIVAKGLMKGVSATEFAPEGTLTRGMFVTILHRVEGEPKAEGELVFTDVAKDQYYAEAVKWANANGIVKGMTETEFAPDMEVTREQMATIIARYAEFKKIEITEEGEVVYTDSDEVAEYAKDAVVAAKRLGILIGNADGTFAPKRNTTRAEAAALFVRLLDVLAK